MAVDVPESFIARNKTPPRYPPPRSNTSQVNHIKNVAMQQVLSSHTQKLGVGKGENGNKNVTQNDGNVGGGERANSVKTVSRDEKNVDDVEFGRGDDDGISLELEPFAQTYHNTNTFHNHIHNNFSTLLASNNINHVNNNNNNSNESINETKSNTNLSENKGSSPFLDSSLLCDRDESSISIKNYDSISFKTKSRGSNSTRCSTSSGEIGPPEYELTSLPLPLSPSSTSNLRELAIDVPDSFSESRNAPPCYSSPQEQNKVVLIKDALVKHDKRDFSLLVSSTSASKIKTKSSLLSSSSSSSSSSQDETLLSIKNSIDKKSKQKAQPQVSNRIEVFFPKYHKTSFYFNFL